MSFTVKKMGVVSMTAAALLVVSWGAQAEGTDGSPAAVVHITGSVTGNTCTPEWTAGQNVEIALGKVSGTKMKAVGDVGTTQPFSLSLKDCDKGITKVAVTAKGQPDKADSSAFANTAANGATGVAVSLFGGDDGATPLAANSATAVEYKVTNGAAVMSFLAKLKRSALVGDKGTENGAVDSTATLFMSYE